MSWDLLRVLAVFAVVVQHATHQGPASHPELGPAAFTMSLQFGASTLLVVSAFFVCATIRRGRPLRWWWNRVARLLPPYLAAVLFTYAVVDLAAIPGWYHPNKVDLVGNLLMVQAWFPDVHYVDGAYWTLPIQLIAFTAAALLWPSRWMRGWRGPATLWAIIVVPMLLKEWRTGDAPQLMQSLYDGLGTHRAHLFGAGAAIWLWSRNRLASWHLAALLVAVLMAQEVQASDLPSTTAFGVMLLLVCLAASGPDWEVATTRPLRRPIQFLAGISFGVYLLNQDVGYVTARWLLDRGAGPWTRLLAVIALAVLLGWLLTVLVERPVHRLLTGPVVRPLATLRRSVGLGERWGTRFAQALRLGRALGEENRRERERAVSAEPDQAQGGSSGSSPASVLPSPRPVSQASTAEAPPRIGDTVEPAPFTSQSR
ncbi:acyltransferase [Longimycelium tulufanense]|uniref:Acyltransferase n=1 Tax=Longimycelium tulufanense TaxID=907463 RepID=A0A8J3FWZ0_9PSEU|nr:acyltransferase [Longimycelium tulufanense]GGM70522.1 acyltransferase [Longimycelium tulufanense]